MILRYTPQYAPNFILQIESSDEQFFMLFTNVDSQVNINIRGNDGVSLAKGYAYYLETYLHVSLSFTGDNLHDLPTVPPEVPAFITQRRWSRYSYYQNVCTASYSMAWWDWERWQKEIDWMAMKGINLPLMFTGQEYVMRETFKYFGVPHNQTQDYFSGPAFLAWNRMGNIKGFGGPLPESWIVQ